MGYLRERPPVSPAANPFQDNFMGGPLDDFDDDDDEEYPWGPDLPG